MTETDALSGTLAAPEGPPCGLAPLRLGDPSEAVLELVDRRDLGVIDVETAWRTVRLGRAGAELLSDWLARYLEKPSDGELELWTATGIAQEAGVSRRTVYDWIKAEDFPEAFSTPVGGSAVWVPDEVRHWMANRELDRGGRPKAIRP